MSTNVQQELILPSTGVCLTLVDETAEIASPDLVMEASNEPVSPKMIKKFVEQHHTAGMRLLCGATIHFYQAGEVLLALQNRLPPNEWLKFLRSNFANGKSPVSIRTCQRYMQITRWIANIAFNRGITIDATRVSHPEAQRILDGLSLRAALRLTSILEEQHDSKNEGAEHQSTNASPLADPSPNDWLTPEPLIEGLLAFWKRIDLDPCAATNPSFHLPAKVQFALEDDGLASDNTWRGNAFINPGQIGDLRPWVERAVAEFHRGQIREAILLLPAVTDANWADLIQPHPRAFLHARPLVICPQLPEMPLALPHPAMLVFLGPADRLAKFAEVFGGLAGIYQPFVS